MADLRGFRDEFVRQINKRIPAQFMAGTVADTPDTWAHTVPVQVGIELVVAAYRGRVPVVGEEVWVQRQGAGYKLITQVPRSASSGPTGSALNPPVQPGSGRPPVSSFTFWGHSFTHSPGSPLAAFSYAFPWSLGSDESQVSPWRIDRVLGSLLGIDDDHIRHWGWGGACLLSDEQPAYPVPGLMPNQTRHGWAWILQKTSNPHLTRYGWPPQTDPRANALNPLGSPPTPAEARSHLDSQFAPFMPMNTAHVMLHGTNDVGFFGDPNATVDGVPNMILTAWTEANRAVISRFRAGAIIEDHVIYKAGTPGTVPGQQYGFTYASSSGAAWSTVGGAKAGNPTTQVYTPQTPLTLYNSGDSLTGKTSGAGTIVAHFGADWGGGVATFRFRGEATTGGTVTIGAETFSTAHRMPATKASIPHADDATVASTAYMTVPAWVPSFGVIARRIPLARTGAAQTITITVNAAAGPVWFDGMDLEQTGMAPPVVVGNIPIPYRWPGAYSTQPVWAAYPDKGSTGQSAVGGGDTTGLVRGPQVTESGDTWALALNTALTAVVAEFLSVASVSTVVTTVPTNAVAIADLYAAMDGTLRPELYFPDVLHPNASGTAVVAAAYYRALSVATADPVAAATLGAA